MKKLLSALLCATSIDESRASGMSVRLVMDAKQINSK